MVLKMRVTIVSVSPFFWRPFAFEFPSVWPMFDDRQFE